MKKLIIKNKYGVIPNSILNNNKISLKAKGLFGYIQSKPDDWQFSISRIKYDMKEGQDSISKGLKELERFGYLKRNKYQDQKGFWNIDYFLQEKPVQEKPVQEKPVQEKLYNNSKKEIIKKEIIKKENTIMEKKILELFEKKVLEIDNKKSFGKVFQKLKGTCEKYNWNIEKFTIKFIDFLQKDKYYGQNLGNFEKLNKNYGTLLARVVSNSGHQQKIVKI